MPVTKFHIFNLHNFTCSDLTLKHAFIDIDVYRTGILVKGDDHGGHRFGGFEANWFHVASITGTCKSYTFRGIAIVGKSEVEAACRKVLDDSGHLRVTIVKQGAIVHGDTHGIW